jgi:hypothetical protein
MLISMDLVSFAKPCARDGPLASVFSHVVAGGTYPSRITSSRRISREWIMANIQGVDALLAARPVLFTIVVFIAYLVIPGTGVMWKRFGFVVLMWLLVHGITAHA